MGFKTHGFMQDKDWIEDVGHIVLGSLPIDILWYIREHTTVKLPWPFKGQYPPGRPMYVYWDQDGRRAVSPEDPTLTEVELEAYFTKKYFPADRVHDSKRDELGRSIGAQLRPIWVALITWSIIR
tara:strand:+ start:1895 stop:2269 length:375 start_codon:yes stop_codon:yes gene_type:complete